MVLIYKYNILLIVLICIIYIIEELGDEVKGK